MLYFIPQMVDNLIEPMTRIDQNSVGNSQVTGELADGFKPSAAGRALAKALKFLATEWNWSGSKIADVLHLKSRTVNAWIKDEKIPIEDTNLSPDLQAIVHLVAIHRSLSAMFNSGEFQQEWLKTKHPDLNKSPLALMSESMDGLIYVRQYLDYVRGRGA